MIFLTSGKWSNKATDEYQYFDLDMPITTHTYKYIYNTILIYQNTHAAPQDVAHAVRI